MIEADARALLIYGYATIFDVPCSGGDTVIAGAFEETLATGRSLPILWDHDPDKPVGVWRHVEENARGLLVVGELSEVNTIKAMHAGAIDGLSIGFRTMGSKSNGAGRILTQIDLWEISLVYYPMHRQARVMGWLDQAFSKRAVNHLKRLALQAAEGCDDNSPRIKPVGFSHTKVRRQNTTDAQLAYVPERVAVQPKRTPV